MPSSNQLKQVMIKTLGELHHSSKEATNEQWFSRGDIARQLGAKHGLNPQRVDVLRALVTEEKIVQRQKPNDAREFPQYRLP